MSGTGGGRGGQAKGESSRGRAAGTEAAGGKTLGDRLEGRFAQTKRGRRPRKLGIREPRASRPSEVAPAHGSPKGRNVEDVKTEDVASGWPSADSKAKTQRENGLWE